MSTIVTDIVVLGAGPGGYAAAFYAADKGRSVILVEKDVRLGGVCLNRGCIPSKAYLNVAKVIEEAKKSEQRGLTFGAPKLELEKLRGWKNSIVTKLAQGVAALAKARGVQVIQGRAHFEGSTSLRVETNDGQKFITFSSAIIAVGSKPAIPKAFDLGNPRVMTSDEALEVEEIPKDMLVVGGGYIGMELSTVYAALGSRVVLVEGGERLLSAADRDLSRFVDKRAREAFAEVRTGVKVQAMSTSGKKIKVEMKFEGKNIEEQYDRVLVSVGRVPNTEDFGLENTAVKCDEKGFVQVDEEQRTADSHIFAIGDVVGGAMLAHKASKEARIAVENICGEPSAFKDFILPAVVFTDPELAWCGLMEDEAKAKGIAVEVAKFPWTASGRALGFDRTDGLTKLIIEPGTERILGVGIVGAHAGDLISEGVLAIEMGATVSDLAQVIHPHPTLSETLMEAAEVFYGHSTHFVSRK